MPVNTEQHLYSPWIGLVYIFNLIVGTGALTLPAVYANAGWLLSLVLVSMLAFVGYITVTFVIESISCANATLHWKRVQDQLIDAESESLTDIDEVDNINEETAMIRARRCHYSLNQRIELGKMADLYFNKIGRTLFFIALCIYLYGDLSIYATAIAKSVSDLVCNSSNASENFQTPCSDMIKTDKIIVYRIFVIVFACLVGPFSYFDVQKTKYLQLTTSLMRLFAFTIMLTIAICQLIQVGPRGTPPMINFAGIPALIGASVYSFMSHHSIPGLVSPFSDKKQVKVLLGLDYLLICTFYILLAVTGSFAFEKLSDLYTLNFVPSSLNISGVFMTIVEYFLGLFPAFTLSTSFPIIAITLQNNLKALCLDVNALHSYNFVVRRLVFPTLVIVPPIIVALLTHNVGSLVEYTGSFGGAAIQYFIPTALVWAARRHCKSSFGVVANKYSSPFKGNIWIAFVICWSIMCIILVIINLFKYFVYLLKLTLPMLFKCRNHHYLKPVKIKQPPTKRIYKWFASSKHSLQGARDM